MGMPEFTTRTIPWDSTYEACLTFRPTHSADHHRLSAAARSPSWPALATFETLAQRLAGDAQQARGMALVATSFLQHLVQILSEDFVQRQDGITRPNGARWRQGSPGG